MLSIDTAVREVPQIICGWARDLTGEFQIQFKWTGLERRTSPICSLCSHTNSICSIHKFRDLDQKKVVDIFPEHEPE
jgi:hypothetical protein